MGASLMVGSVLIGTDLVSESGGVSEVDPMVRVEVSRWNLALDWLGNGIVTLDIHPSGICQR